MSKIVLRAHSAPCLGFRRVDKLKSTVSFEPTRIYSGPIMVKAIVSFFLDTKLWSMKLPFVMQEQQCYHCSLVCSLFVDSIATMSH